ncbi:hypothetical protein Tco_1136371 [Tanacetum coccineum]
MVLWLTFGIPQQDWKLISWKLHSFFRGTTIYDSTGLVFHMLVESEYPLTMDSHFHKSGLKLETEKKRSMALEVDQSFVTQHIWKNLNLLMMMDTVTLLMKMKKGLSVG